MRAPKIIFFDIDDTLYYKDEKRIPTSICEQVIPRLKAKGIIPAIATGRCFGAFPKALVPLLNEQGFEVFVTINGQYNFNQKGVISQYSLEQVRIAKVVEKLTALGIAYAFVCHEQIAVSEDNPDIAHALKPIKEDYIVDPNYYQDHTVIQILAFYSEFRQAEVAAAGVFEDDLKAVRWHDFSVDILNKNNSKAQGVADILAHYGFEIYDAMAFGDGLNDIEMLSMVGTGVAMGNAVDELKSIANYITLPIEQDGILDSLVRLKVI